MEHQSDAYPARLEVDYPERLDRVSTLLRVPFIIPIAIVSYLMPVAPLLAVSLAVEGYIDDSGTGWFAAAFFLPLILMILFRRKYPRWWFDFLIELTRFQYRVAAYGTLLTDKYPSTDEEQSVHLELDYPDTEQLNNLMPVVKWLLLIPHYIVLVVLSIAALVAVIAAWFAILISARYPRFLFNLVVGLGRYWLRVEAYGFLLITDRYPPFRLSA